MSAIRLRLGYESPVMAVPCPFIDQYMSACPPVYALIYLYSLRCMQGGEPVTTSALASRFNILETDVYNAWRHWEETGIVAIESPAPEMTIAFLPPEQWAVAKAVPKAAPKVAQITAPAAEKNFTPATERPVYNVDELTLFKEKSHEVAQLFNRAEETLGKLLTYHDMNVLFGFYDWLRLPVEVLDFLLVYCAEHNHRNLRYIEKCALDWADRGIDSAQKAREYTETFDTAYRAILQAMGQSGGHVTPSQKKYIEKWRTEWAMPLPLILEACDRASVQIGKPKFTYVDKIIAAWYNAGVKTLEAVHIADEEFTKGRESGKPPLRIIKPKSTKFANFTQRVNDYSAIERKERELLLREMQG
ncbi:MAG: DnaD domain protein [Defluviitaleaceae bacterium]|nr:DnaD domain protein [Defluviitaleaceae bacterium]MCL2189775.1 DnaD domain protein [Defluviitaleaceae bacterium]MCL2275407.1 DnaD domain protein [Defluviitaleaceae bacterium]